MFRRRSDFWEFTERIGLDDWYLSVVRGSRSHAVARAHFDPQRTRREGIQSNWEVRPALGARMRMHLLNIKPFSGHCGNYEDLQLQKVGKKCVHLWYTRKGPIMPLLGCSSLNIQVTRSDREFDSPNLNVIFISIQWPTRHSFKRILLSIYLSFFILILMLDPFLVFPLCFGHMLRESKVSGNWERREWGRTRVEANGRGRKASMWGNFATFPF